MLILFGTSSEFVSNSTPISADYHVHCKTFVGQSLEGDTCSQNISPYHLANLPLISAPGIGFNFSLLWPDDLRCASFINTHQRLSTIDGQ